jgi:type III restriction enzyme
LPSVIIENPVINPPFDEPTHHFKFSDDGITDEIVESRRRSSYFIPVPRPRKQGAQLALDDLWTADREMESEFINEVRERVRLWRSGGYRGITRTTATLLAYWKNPEREHRLYFCQIEALETAIFLTEVASRYGEANIENRIREFNAEANPQLYRIAFKMATGSGKTVVMAMLIAWHTLNKAADRQNALFSDAFLVVSPGITIRDRLRVLLPNDPQNFYDEHDLVPPLMKDDLYKAKIIVTNFHQFKLAERENLGKVSREILRAGETKAFTETPAQMVSRVCRDLAGKKGIIVINDEAHHCYRHKQEEEEGEEKLVGQDRKEAEKREEAARVWISGLEAVKKKLGVKVVYDLSATPFFLRGSGYPEAKLFPWVVSDFSLIDAIECGIVKVPRVPVSDNSMVGEQPTYRDLWYRIRSQLPKKGRSVTEPAGEPQLPKELEGAIQSLYQNYQKSFEMWQEGNGSSDGISTPPVFIVVANNTSVSKLIYDYIAGYPKALPDGTTVNVPGKLPLFSNVDHGQWSRRPFTILVDSEQLESGDAMSADFKQIAAREIEEFKEEYKQRFPGRDVSNLTDEDLLREVMNTVGKPGKLGEQIRCVVSVSMLTEGWDANTVTHILGVRAFGTHLLCEQVIGRGLRRISHALNSEGRFDPEYAEVYGVPFSFIPCAGAGPRPTPPVNVKRVRALDERKRIAISYPRVTGYRYKLPSEKLTANFTADAQMILSTASLPTTVQNAPIVGEISILTLDDLKARREQEVVFILAKTILEKYFRDGEQNVKPWLFPQLLGIVQRWAHTCLQCKDHTFPQLLLFVQLAHEAADKIYRAIVAGETGEKLLLPIMLPYESVGSSEHIDFNTRRDTYLTRADKCNVSHVVLDSGWEAKLAQELEDWPEVVCYVKNQHLGFSIPYTIDGQEHGYYPDFIVRMDDGGGSNNQLNLILEVTGEAKPEKAVKASTARNLWVPAINNYGAFGRWAYLEVRDPWNVLESIRTLLQQRTLTT